MTGPVVGIDHVQVAAPSGCEADARRFFGDVLGLEEVPKPAPLASRGGCWFRVGGQQLHVGVEEDFAAAAKAHPALRVESSRLEELALRLIEAGSPVTWDDGLAPSRRFYTADPWGNRLELTAAP